MNLALISMSILCHYPERQRPGSLAAMEQGRRPQRNSGQVHPFVMIE